MSEAAAAQNPLYSEQDKARPVPDSADGRDRDYRPCFRRDFARLIHSPAFRRLQGKLQLYPGHESDFFRNRLTHSLEVAQIAKSIALKFNRESEDFRRDPIDLDLVEFAGLAHDIGHAPFGHTGEHALHRCMAKFGGFEGNAQTFRIIACLEKKQVQLPEAKETSGFTLGGEDKRVGLNPTFRSLAALLKYDNTILVIPTGAEFAKGYYSCDSALVQRVKAAVGRGYEVPEGEKWRTIECQIMDAADDIAYSTYDLEDALKGGVLTPLTMLSRLHADRRLRENVTKEVKKACPDANEGRVIDAVSEIFDKLLPEVPIDLPPLSRAVRVSRTLDKFSNNGYFRRELSASLIDQFVSAVRVEYNSEYPTFSRLRWDEDILLVVESLKHLNYYLVIESPALKRIAFRGAKLVTNIFNTLIISESGWPLLPYDVREPLELVGTDDLKRSRIICDFIAGMTDRYAIEFYGRLTDGRGSMFAPL